jgi:glucose/arabinose dehydrogenase
MNPQTARVKLAILGIVATLAATGCVGSPTLLPEAKRTVIDRGLIERPVGLEVTTFIPNLTTPTSIAFVPEGAPHPGAVIVAEGGIDGGEPKIFGFKPDGTRFDIYPVRDNVFVSNPLARFFTAKSRIFGPVGGIALKGSEIFVSHRDDEGRGVVSAFTYDGKRRTVVGDLPARGDFGVTDLAFHPDTGRLYFGVGAATNSGVVGIDNWDAGWVRRNRDVCDVPAVDLKLLGARFDTPNPTGGLLGGSDIAVTSPFQPFGSSTRLRIPKSPTDRPTAALYSISPGGGDLRVEAHGVRHPRGLAFNEYGNLFLSNQGMEMRGTRPVQDDPDAVLRLPPGGGTWFGWPDYSADLVPITDSRFKPPMPIILRTGYPEIVQLVDHAASGLIRPDRGTLVRGLFPSLSGASKMTFVGGQPGFTDFNGSLLVALAGDRFPFATSDQRLAAPVGYKVMRVDPDTKQTTDFIYNTPQRPASKSTESPLALERPIDVKFGPDGSLYIVDLGRVEYRDGQPRVAEKTGKVLRVAPTTRIAATRPTK